MDNKRLFIGNIKKCTKLDLSNIFVASDFKGKQKCGKPVIDSEIYKENAILVRTYRYGFVDLEDYDKKTIEMSINPVKEGDLFVDYDSLKVYSETNDKMIKKAL